MGDRQVRILQTYWGLKAPKEMRNVSHARTQYRLDQSRRCTRVYRKGKAGVNGLAVILQ